MAKYPVKLKGGFLLRTVETDDDIERLAAFNKLVHEGEDLESLVRSLILEHHYGARRFWLFIEEPRTKKIVSALSLIPWRVDFCGVLLRAAELGFVGTRPGFRKLGLSRLLTAHFHGLVERGGFAFSFLQGIPYYYRQYGYEYAVQLENHFVLPLSRLPRPDIAPAIRRALPSDTPRLIALYGRSMRAYPLHNARTAEVWDYLLGPSLKTEMSHDTFCVPDGRGKTAAYFRVAHHGFGAGLILDEISAVGPETMEAVLGFCRGLARERRKPALRVNLHRAHPLARRALELGARDEWNYAWQIRIGRPGRFLKALAPLWERRLAHGACRGLTRRVTIDFYREAWALDFKKGRLTKVGRSAADSAPALRLPPFAAVPLLFGHRSLVELRGIYPDVNVEGDAKVWDALFPKFDSWFHVNY